MLPSANDVALRLNKWYNSVEVIEIKEDKLSDLSMQLSVDVLNLVKELRHRKETIISNQKGVEILIGSIVKVIVDRPLGTYHPKHKDIYYSVNYGYIPNIIAPDGEEQDAYILGVDKPIEEFVGKVIAIIHRIDDVEEKLIVAPENISFTKDEIIRQVAFQEQFFKTEIRM